MITWNRVDFPEPVLPATSACWQVPLPMARYWNLVAPVRPTGTLSSVAVFSDQISASGGATWANGTSTRLESRLLTPTLLTNSIADYGGGGASRVRSVPGIAFPAKKNWLPLPLRQTLVARSSSGMNSGGKGWRWSRSEEHTSELQSLRHLVCRLLLAQ